jgi:F0F1-type ATP synthase assembly protein I
MKNIAAREKGIITGVLMVAAVLICFYGIHANVNGYTQYLAYGIYMAGILWCLFDFKKTAPAAANFKDYFSAGFKTFIVVVLIMAIFTYIFYSNNLQLRDGPIAENNRLLLLEGNKTPAEIEANASQLRKIFLPMMTGIFTFKYLIIGALVTAVGAAFLGQKKAE